MARATRTLRTRNLTTKAFAFRFILLIVITAIFIFDTLSKLEIAAAVFYIVVILIGSRGFSRLGVIALSSICFALTVISFFATKTGDLQTGLANTLIALMALVSTTYIVVWAKTAEQNAIRALERLNRVARIQSLGELIASIGHEINQPLAAATVSADACRNWLFRDPPDIDRAKAALERVTRETSRAAAVIERIRSLSKNEAPYKEFFDLNTIVAETLEISAQQIDTIGIHLEWNKADQPLIIEADRVQLMQVTSNLVLNAISAVKTQKSTNRFISVTTRRDENHKVCLIITDTGCGIAESDLAHIFDAFWTKREGGTGLGLTLVRAIVEAHKGIIEARHNPHGGASFKVVFPEARQRPINSDKEAKHD